MWIITQGQNDNYPINQDGIDYVYPLWSGTIPNQLWRILQGVNDGYPNKPYFKETPLFDGILPVAIWRIADGVNDNYPYRWYQMAVQSGYINQGDVVIGSDDGLKIFIDNNNNNDSTTDPDRSEIKPPNREGDNIPLHLDNRFGAFNGFLTLYNLTENELSNFGSALIGNPLNYRGNFQKDLSDELSGTYDVASILSYIVSVKMYPFSVGTLVNTTTVATSNVYIGTGEFGVPIGTPCRTLTSSISVVNAGSLNVAPLTPYMDFRDYYNTTVVCYLPYCGSVELNPMDIMNTILQCYYLIDFLTGECTAVLYSIGGNNLNYPVAIANGNIGIDIPLSATNSGQLSAVKKMQNAQTAHTIISYINSGLNVINDAMNLSTSNAITSIIGEVGGAVDNYFSNSANPYGANRSARSAVATPLMPTGSGATNFMLNDSVYLQIRRGTYSRPNNYGSTMAYPNTFSAKLSTVSGLTYCSNVNVTGINCTQEEKNLIKVALESGTIL